MLVVVREEFSGQLKEEPFVSAKIVAMAPFMATLETAAVEIVATIPLADIEATATDRA